MEADFFDAVEGPPPLDLGATYDTRVRQIINGVVSQNLVLLQGNRNRVAFRIQPILGTIAISTSTLTETDDGILVGIDEQYEIKERDFPTLPGLPWFFWDDLGGIRINIIEVIRITRGGESSAGKISKSVGIVMPSRRRLNSKRRARGLSPIRRSVQRFVSDLR